MLVLLPRVMAMVNFFMGPPRTEDGRSIERRALMGGRTISDETPFFAFNPKSQYQCVSFASLCVPSLYILSSTHHLSMVEKKVVWFCVEGTRMA